ncbi:MAG: hypothetical protein H7Z42_18015 [Roseiflexaceae bacterium]|nr:hypothetical protein [Roseiflexaceae bacterium]
MIIQKRDGSLVEPSTHTSHDAERHFYAEIAPDELDVQTSLIERLITMAFDVLGVRHLEVHVRGNEQQ